MRLTICWILTLAVVIVLAGAVAAEGVVELVDHAGETVRIPQPIERLISVYGIGTFIVYALGVGDRLVMAWYVGVKGISSASEGMLRLEPRLEELLAFGDPNVEEIAARDAQLVLADASRHATFAEQMTEIGVPVIQYLIETPETLKEAVLLTGRALGPETLERANVFVSDYDRVFSVVTSDLEALAEDERVRVLFLGTDPMQVASGDMYQTHLIEAAGGVSVSEELRGYWNEVNLEQVLLWNPDVILIPPYGPVQPEDILGNPDWASIGAVRDGRVHRMPRVIAPMDTPVPESLLGLAWMATLFYPDLVRLDLRTEVDRFYAFYYGYELAEAELEHLTGR